MEEKVEIRTRINRRKQTGDLKNDCSKSFTIESLRPYFKYSLRDAAERLGICCTSLKKICRALGIRNWPFRNIKANIWPEEPPETKEAEPDPSHLAHWPKFEPDANGTGIDEWLETNHIPTLPAN